MKENGLKYTDDDIQTLSDTEWILLRPEVHIRDTNEEGQLHIIKEIFDNSLDETEIGPGGRVDILLFLDKDNMTYQVVIRDNGRGIPLGKLKESFTQLKTSGKYDKASYHTAGGLNGIGGKVAMTLSENFKVITYRDNKIGQLVFHRAELVAHSVDDYISEFTGTLVAMEPRKGFFSGVDVFIEYAHEQLVRLALLLGMFSRNTHITTRAVYKSIDPEFWTMNAANSLDFIEWKYNDIAVTLTDGADNETAMQYLKELWQVDSKFVWTLEKMYGVDGFGDNILEYDISLFLPKIYRGMFTTSIVNNIPMKDNSSSHITGLFSVLKKKLAQYIEIPEMQQYFLDFYKIPMCAAIAIKYGNVRFTSLAKDGFKSAAFESRYTQMLESTFSQVEEEIWKDLYSRLEEDINLKYHQYYNKPMTSRRDAKKLSLEITDRKFYDCNISDRSKAELIIVEGVSASHVRHERNPEFQAVFMIRGKPLNVNKTDKARPDTISRLKSYPAYADLIKILNIQPGQTDLSTANYGKIILMQDADVDGGHIRALHIGALHEINPRIIDSGMVYLANPPLYEILLDEKTDKKKFVRTKPELIKFRIECLYRPTLSLKITGMTDLHKSNAVPLKGDAFTDFCMIITAIGEMFDELSNRLVIPPLILEKLTHLTPYIQPGRVDANVLREEFGRGTRYSERLNILTIADQDRDVSFSLDGVSDALYESVMGVLHRLSWKKLKILASTNFTDTLKDTHISIVQLYQIFETLNKKLYVQRHKGLGGMEKSDLGPTCIHPSTRYLHKITSIGDFKRIHALLGDDTTARRQILCDYGLLDPM